MKPRIWPYAAAFLVGVFLWTGYIMNDSYHYWQTTGQEMMDMGSSIRNGILAVLGIAVLAYGGSWAWMLRSSGEITEVASKEQAAPVALESNLAKSHAMLAQTGKKFVLEVRGMGVAVAKKTDEEIWEAIEEKADNHATYFSQNPEDYTDSADQRLSDLGVATRLPFKEAAGRAVDQWPLPVIIWYPPKSKRTSRPAGDLAGIRQMAGLGVTLLLWQEDANTEDGAAMIERLFTFFDTHPDVPAALIFSTDGSMMRSLMQTPGNVDTPEVGHVIPAMPDSVAAFLVTRSDRVDKLIRPYVVQQRSNVNKNDTEFDIVKLWNFYWKKTEDRSPDGFNTHYLKEEKEAGVGSPAMSLMSASWWQGQLPELWKNTTNQGPGDFKPTPYIPVRWTNWQLKQYDSAPLLG
ncbi:type VI lipase adapter Tla3 domain-containing protein, partial [Herbaspirillum huttiense]